MRAASLLGAHAGWGACVLVFRGTQEPPSSEAPRTSHPLHTGCHGVLPADTVTAQPPVNTAPGEEVEASVLGSCLLQSPRSGARRGGPFSLDPQSSTASLPKFPLLLYLSSNGNAVCVCVCQRETETETELREKEEKRRESRTAGPGENGRRHLCPVPSCVGISTPGVARGPDTQRRLLEHLWGRAGSTSGSSHDTTHVVVTMKGKRLRICRQENRLFTLSFIDIILNEPRKARKRKECPLSATNWHITPR